LCFSLPFFSGRVKDFPTAPECRCGYSRRKKGKSGSSHVQEKEDEEEEEEKL